MLLRDHQPHVTVDIRVPHNNTAIFDTVRHNIFAQLRTAILKVKNCIFSEQPGQMTTKGKPNTTEYLDYYTSPTQLKLEKLRFLDTIFNGQKSPILSDHGMPALSAQCTGARLAFANDAGCTKAAVCKA